MDFFAPFDWKSFPFDFRVLISFESMFESSHLDDSENFIGGQTEQNKYFLHTYVCVCVLIDTVKCNAWVCNN